MSTMKASASPAAPTPRRSKRTAKLPETNKDEAADASAGPSCGEASRTPNANGGEKEARSADARSRRPRGKKTQTQSNAESSARKEKPAASSSARIDDAVDDLGNVLMGLAVSGRKLKRIQGSIKTLRNVARELRSYKHDDDSDDENCPLNRSQSTPESRRTGKTSTFKLSPSDESSVCCSLFKSSSDDDSECSEDESDSDESNGLSNGRSKAREERANTSYSYSFGTMPPRVDLATDRRHRQDSADAAKKRREEEEESARAAVAEDKRREEEARVRMEEDAADERRRRAKEAAQMAEEQMRRKAQADAIEEVLRVHDSDLYSHYKVLGVASDASAAEINRTYKNLARKLHPDKSTLPGAEDAFNVINVAYEVINDPNSRAEYDRSCQAHASTAVPTQPDFTPGSSALTIIPKGTRVTFCNLNLASQHLQGKRGTVEGFSAATRQYLVRLDNQFFTGGSTFNADPVILFQNVTAKLRWRTQRTRFGIPFCVSTATVDSYSEESNTYKVSYCINGRRKVDHLGSNWIILPKGTVVRLKDPLLGAEYNGKYGQIVGWEDRLSKLFQDGQYFLSDVSHGLLGDPSYYTVQMSAENFLQVKMANVCL